MEWNLDPHGSSSKSSNLLLHPVIDIWSYSDATRHHYVSREFFFLQILAPYHVGIQSNFLDDEGFYSQEGMLDEILWAVGLFITNSDDPAIRQLIAPPQKGERHSDDYFLFRVHSDIEQFLLDVIFNFPLDYVKKL